MLAHAHTHTNTNTTFAYVTWRRTIFDCQILWHLEIFSIFTHCIVVAGIFFSWRFCCCFFENLLPTLAQPESHKNILYWKSKLCSVARSYFIHTYIYKYTVIVCFHRAESLTALNFHIVFHAAKDLRCRQSETLPRQGTVCSTQVLTDRQQLLHKYSVFLYAFLVF